MAAPSSSSSTRAQALYQLGVTRLAQGDLREAYEDLKEASRLDPNNLEIMLKYEEAYSAARELLAEEQARTAAPPASSSSGAARGAKAGADELPPTMTFTKEQTGQVEKRSSRQEEADQSQSQQLQARMFKKGLLDPDPLATDTRHMADLGYGGEATGQAPTHWSQAPSSSGYPAQDIYADDEPLDGGINMQSPKMLMATILCWLVIWLIVTYYYQIETKRAQKKPVQWAAVTIWSLVIVVACAGAWRFATHCRVKYISMSDGIKITCFIVIVIAVLWHKLWQEPTWLADQNKVEPSTGNTTNTTPAATG